MHRFTEHIFDARCPRHNQPPLALTRAPGSTLFVLKTLVDTATSLVDRCASPTRGVCSLYHALEPECRAVREGEGCEEGG